MNDQRSLTDQLWSLVKLANKNGHYDAADWVKNHLDKSEYRTVKEGDVDSHRERHELLHRCLDELVADWISQTNNFPSKSTVLQLMDWSAEQTRNPTRRDEL